MGREHANYYKDKRPHSDCERVWNFDCRTKTEEKINKNTRNQSKYNCGEPKYKQSMT